MGKRKFTNEEETRIVEFLKKWRHSNPYALEWPIDEVRQGARLPEHYTNDQVRHKISALQKKAKQQESPYHGLSGTLNLRTNKQNIKETVVSNDELGFNTADTLAMPELENLVAEFQNVDPSRAFSGLFLIELHQKFKFGETFQESWNVIAQNWEVILKQLPLTRQMSLFEKAKETPHGSKLFTEKCQENLMNRASSKFNFDGNATTTGQNQNHGIQTDLKSRANDYATSDESNENASDNEISFIRDHGFDKPKQIVSKYLEPALKNDWSFSSTEEFEPTCEIFGATPVSSVSITSEKWPILLDKISRDSSLHQMLTDDKTWTAILAKAQITDDACLTKFEFFRKILPRRELYFRNVGSITNLQLKPTQKESLNLLFYGIYEARAPADIQSLFDEGFLSSDYEFYKWIFLLKARLNQENSNSFFNCCEQEKCAVNKRLFILLFSKGFLNAYKAGPGKLSIENLVRSLYASRIKFLD